MVTWSHYTTARYKRGMASTSSRMRTTMSLARVVAAMEREVAHIPRSCVM